MKGCDCIFGKTFLVFFFFFFSFTRKELGLGESQVLLEMRLTSGIKIVCVLGVYIFMYVVGAYLETSRRRGWLVKV